jgi:hypothetical protein
MAAMSDFLETEILDHVLRNAAYTQPAVVYVSLHTTATTDAGGGTEVAGGAYARQACTFGAPSGGASTTTIDITFPTATAGWGTVTHAAVWDAATVGNMLFHGALTASKVVATNDVFKFLAGSLTVTLA